MILANKPELGRGARHGKAPPPGFMNQYQKKGVAGYISRKNIILKDLKKWRFGFIAKQHQNKRVTGENAGVAVTSLQLCESEAGRRCLHRQV
jgi:hypothetical protein